jgi:hypothetical protein
VSIVAQIEPPLDLLRFTLAVDGILGLLATGDFASLDALHPTPRLSGADVQRIVAAAGIRLGPAPRPTWPHYRVDVPADGTVVVETPIWYERSRPTAWRMTQRCEQQSNGALATEVLEIARTAT